MPIPRFQLRTMMIAVAVIALWLASFGMDYGLGVDVRRSIRLLLFLAVFFCAVCYRGVVRVFWVGFVIVMLLVVRPVALLDPFRSWFVPAMDWSERAATFGCELVGVESSTPTGASRTWLTINDTTDLISLGVLAALGGGIAAWVYRRANRKASE